MSSWPPAPPDRDAFGVAELGRVRFKQGLLGIRAERLCERADGSRFWRRLRIGEIIETALEDTS